MTVGCLLVTITVKERISVFAVIHHRSNWSLKICNKVNEGHVTKNIAAAEREPSLYQNLCAFSKVHYFMSASEGNARLILYPAKRQNFSP